MSSRAGQITVIQSAVMKPSAGRKHSWLSSTGQPSRPPTEGAIGDNDRFGCRHRNQFFVRSRTFAHIMRRTWQIELGLAPRNVIRENRYLNTSSLGQSSQDRAPIIVETEISVDCGR